MIGIGWGLSPHASSFKLKFTVSETSNSTEFLSKCLPETPGNETCWSVIHSANVWPLLTWGTIHESWDAVEAGDLAYTRKVVYDDLGLELNWCQRVNDSVKWWSGVVVSALALINKVNLRRAQDGRPCPGSFPSAGHLFRYVTNQPPNANLAFHPCRVGKWVPASAGKSKPGMVHSVSGWTRGVQVKLWDLLKTRAIPERLRGVITTRCYTNLHLPLPYLTF